MISGVKKNFRAHVYKNPEPQANLDFSEKAVTGSQHTPINNGQVNLTNQDGSTANLDFSEKKITTGTTSYNNKINHVSAPRSSILGGASLSIIGGGGNGTPTNPFNATGNPLTFGGNSTDVFSNNSTKVETPPTNSTEPTPEPTPTPTPTAPVETVYSDISDLGFKQGTIDPETGISKEGGNAFSFTPIDTKVFSVQMGSNNKPIGGNQFNSGKMSEAMYNTTLNKQKSDRKSNLSNMGGWEHLGQDNSKSSFSSDDFFGGTKSGNESFTDTKIKMKDGTQAQTKGYADVNPFGDNGFSTESTFSNEKKNKKALQDQFKMYSDFSNF